MKAPAPSAQDPERRDFVKGCCAAAAGTAAGTVPLAAGLNFLSDPLRRREASAASYLFVANLSALSSDGKPRKFAVIADKSDAWNRTPQVPVGAVYLRLKAPNQVEALNVICPHAGCAVDFQATRESFLCPCHNSLFQLDGTIADRSSPSARGLDSLEVEIRAGGEVWVKFLNFRAGTAEKIPIA